MILRLIDSLLLGFLRTLFEILQLVKWDEIFAVNSQNLESIDKKRLQAVWELFHRELIFLHKQLLVLRLISSKLPKTRNYINFKLV